MTIPFTKFSSPKGDNHPVSKRLRWALESRHTHCHPYRVPARGLGPEGPRTKRKRAARCNLGMHRKSRSCGHRGARTPLTILAAVDSRMDAEAAAFERQYQAIGSTRRAGR